MSKEFKCTSVKNVIYSSVHNQAKGNWLMNGILETVSFHLWPVAASPLYVTVCLNWACLSKPWTLHILFMHVQTKHHSLPCRRYCWHSRWQIGMDTGLTVTLQSALHDLAIPHSTTMRLWKSVFKISNWYSPSSTIPPVLYHTLGSLAVAHVAEVPGQMCTAFVL